MMSNALSLLNFPQLPKSTLLVNKVEIFILQKCEERKKNINEVFFSLHNE